MIIPEKLKISADGYDINYIKELGLNPYIIRIHIGCIENNYKAIEKSEGIENAVVHILINRIDSIEKLKQKLIEFKVQRILLLNGNPHPKPYKHSFIDVINNLKSVVEIFVAAYPTTVFSIQNQQHILTQVQILKEKIDTGAKEIYLQSTYNLKKLNRFSNALQNNNVTVPINYGISPNISLRHAFTIIREMIYPFQALLNFKNLDFIVRLLRTSNNRSAELLFRIKNSSIFHGEDGFHLTTLDSPVSDFFKIIETSKNDYSKVYLKKT